MLSFLKAFEVVISHEGGWVNHPNDTGKETYIGITRKNFPNWKGWKLIDKINKKGLSKKEVTKKIQEGADADTVETLVLTFYKENFWDKLKLDSVKSNKIATVLLDIKINGGRPTTWIQNTINSLNKQASLWDDLEVDGKIGPTTIRLLNKACEEGYELHILECLLSYRTVYYIEISLKREANEDFTKGWINRVICNRKELC